MTDRRQTSQVKGVKVFSDGASRGNPGPSAIAYMILSADDKMMKQYSGFIGVGTNNQAEYKALISALVAASNYTDQEAYCHLDSELVVRQLTGKYKVRNPILRGLWLEVNHVKQRFRIVSFDYTPGTNEYIRKVDSLANNILDTVENIFEIRL